MQVESDASTPTWIGELKQWIAIRFEDENLTLINSEPYRKFLFQQVVSLRSRVLNEGDFVTACKATAWSLLFRAQIFIVGLELNKSPDDVLTSMFAVLPEYPSYRSHEDIFRDQIPMREVGKMQLVEGEMYSLLFTYFSQETDWFEKTLKETRRVAEEYWTKNVPNEVPEELRLEQNQPNTKVNTETPTIPIVERQYKSFSAYILAIIVGIIWMWNSSYESFISNPGEALGHNLFSLGLPLWLTLFAANRLLKGLRQRGTNAAYKVVVGTICFSCSISALLDLLLRSVLPHKLGAIILFIFFGLVSLILFAIAYGQRRLPLTSATPPD